MANCIWHSLIQCWGKKCPRLCNVGKPHTKTHTYCCILVLGKRKQDHLKHTTLTKAQEENNNDRKKGKSSKSHVKVSLLWHNHGVIASWIHAQSTLDQQSRPSFKKQHAKHGYQLSFSYCLSMSYWINNAEPFLTLCSPAARVQPLHP